MKPTKQLIRALRETAHKLRNGWPYDWSTMPQCNCGVLAQTILGVNEKQLWYGLCQTGPGSPWSERAKQIECSETGIPLNYVFRTLLEAGIEEDDFHRIEYLDGSPNRNRRFFVADWMDHEADELERRRSVAAAEAQETGGD